MSDATPHAATDGRTTSVDRGGDDHRARSDGSAERRRDRRRSRSGDRLTGLADRDAFARAVDQADRDRDRLLVAVVTVDGLSEINQLCGYDVGDSLLASLGRVLADRASVDLTAGRVGGSHLALLQTPAPSRNTSDLVGPIVDELDRALGRWLDDRAALGTPCPIVPRARVGVAAGHGGGTWTEAEAALAVAQADPDGPAILSFDLTDPGVARHRRRQLLADEVAEALHQDRLPVDRLPVEPLEPGGPSWVRLVARPSLDRPAPDGPAHGALASKDLDLAPGLAGQIDRHLLERATELPPSSPSTITSLHLLGPLDGPRSVLSDREAGARASPDASPAGLVLAIGQDTLAATDPVALAGRLTELGWRIAITGFDGGWATWAAVDHLPVHHLRPDRDLVDRAVAAERQPTEHLRALAANAAERGLLVTATEPAEDDRSTLGRLRDLGITHLEARVA